MLRTTDQHWHALAQADPYWAVLTTERFRSDRISTAELAQFFRTGEDYVAWVFDTCGKQFNVTLRPQQALDFGCGVGRLAIPLARRCGRVCAVDVADRMIQLARHHAAEQAVENIDRHLGRLETAAVQSYDFVHSFIVLQHIPVRIGLAILATIISRLEPGGIGVLHVTCAKSTGTTTSRPRWLAGVRDALGSVYDRLRALLVPQMQMNIYPLNSICCMLQEAGIRDFHAHYTDHGTYGVVFLFRKTPERSYPSVLSGYS